MKNIFIVFVVLVLSLSLVSVSGVYALGRPANCDDTAYQAHKGYNENQALWDSYMADTDGVCQSRTGTGTPSPCAHIVQLSTNGVPYYLCWYNNEDTTTVQPQTQGNFFEQLIEMIRSFFSQLFSGFDTSKIQGIVVEKNIVEQIGPYQGKYGCEFFQIPWPNVNKKHVSCPYETPGAAINDAANEFCRQVMASAWAEAAICNENGLIVCIHPCETQPAHIMAQRCAFDNDRPRGNQAPPMSWCAPKDGETITNTGEGRPDNCDDTTYQAHPGYNENQALWDSFMADSDGVCQTQYGTGIPSGVCEHAVQLSIQGQPYYLCWYNNP